MNVFNIENARRQTELLRNPTVEPTVDQRTKAIIDAVNAGNWGCQDESVRRLVSVLTGVEIPKRSNAATPFVQGAVIVYDEEVLLIRELDDDGDARILTKEGSDMIYGDSFVTKNSEFRPATDEEINEFFGVA